MTAPHPTSPQIRAQDLGELQATEGQREVEGPLQGKNFKGGQAWRGPELTAFVDSSAQTQVLLLELLVAVLKEADIVDGLAQDGRFIQLQGWGGREMAQVVRPESWALKRGSRAALQHNCLRRFASAIPTPWNILPLELAAQVSKTDNSTWLTAVNIIAPLCLTLSPPPGLCSHIASSL